MGNKINKCPKCQHEIFIKNGRVHGAQRFKCKHCGHQTTRTTLRGLSPENRDKLVFLYVHGLSLHSIGRFFGITAPAVRKHITEYFKDIKNCDPLKLIRKYTKRIYGENPIEMFKKRNSEEPFHTEIKVSLIGDIEILRPTKNQGN